jgi:hypothetical protein
LAGGRCGRWLFERIASVGERAIAQGYRRAVYILDVIRGGQHDHRDVHAPSNDGCDRCSYRRLSDYRGGRYRTDLSDHPSGRGNICGGAAGVVHGPDRLRRCARATRLEVHGRS